MVMNKIQRFEKAYKAVEDANNKLMSSVETLSCIVKKLTGRNITAMLTGSGDVEFRVCSDDDCEEWRKMLDRIKERDLKDYLRTRKDIKICD